ncbi:TonB-dependent receptor [Vibrio renipiscarius]
MASLFSFSAQAESFSLPIWKDKAEALGYELPKAVGFSVSYMTLEQGISVDSIELSGIPVVDMLGIDLEAHGGTQKTEVMTLRADAWLFPFLNVYALVGILEGYSRTDVSISLFDGAVKPKEKIDFELDLEGYTSGVGIVLAGGYKNVFGLVDVNYSKTKLSIIDGEIDAIVISPRVGYDLTKHGVPLRVWAGAMYQDVEQTLKGNISDVMPELNSNGKFTVKQHLTTKWNPLLGLQYQVTDSWYLLGEVGLGDRKSAFVSIDHRF